MRLCCKLSFAISWVASRSVFPSGSYRSFLFPFVFPLLSCFLPAFWCRVVVCGLLAARLFPSAFSSISLRSSRRRNQIPSFVRQTLTVHPSTCYVTSNIEWRKYFAGVRQICFLNKLASFVLQAFGWKLAVTGLEKECM